MCKVLSSVSDFQFTPDNNHVDACFKKLETPVGLTSYVQLWADCDTAFKILMSNGEPVKIKPNRKSRSTELDKDGSR